jgi:hypothetical protein
VAGDSREAAVGLDAAVDALSVEKTAVKTQSLFFS